MTDHEQFQQEPQNPQDPQVVVFSPELLKLYGGGRPAAVRPWRTAARRRRTATPTPWCRWA